MLIGDALHTAHFSIGSGTRLAMEDAIALDAALARHPHGLEAALAEDQTTRRPVVEKLIAAADASGEWYEQFARHIRMEPVDFAMRPHIQRSGRARHRTPAQHLAGVRRPLRPRAPGNDGLIYARTDTVLDMRMLRWTASGTREDHAAFLRGRPGWPRFDIGLLQEHFEQRADLGRDRALAS